MVGSINIEKRKRVFFNVLIVIALILYTSVLSSPLFAEQATQAQTVFQSPEEAMKALVDAVQADNTQKVMTILGPDGKDVVYSGDEVADKDNHAKFVKEYQEKVKFVADKDRISVIIGNDSYPMAIPLVKKDAGWVFDTPAGREEILKRRIGRNELSSIKVCQEYVQAQREYSSVDRNLNGVIEYAQRFCSTPGKRDGLYWEVPETEAPSPIDPLIAAAAGEGYASGKVCDITPEPYHGYIYKILTAQGSDAPGGAYSYVINGNMVAGFALVAWPAEYEVSGVMTFIVNQNGIIYEKDLGTRTDEIVKAMTEYNPDPTWSRAQ
jgi:hypothetical protein